MALNGITNFFVAQRAKNALTEGQRSPQELEVGPNHRNIGLGVRSWLICGYLALTLVHAGILGAVKAQGLYKLAQNAFLFYKTS